MSELPLLITLGDPNGLGPELAARLLTSDSFAEHGNFVLIGPGQALEQVVSQFGLPMFWTSIQEDQLDALPARFSLLTPKGLEDFPPEPGRPTPGGGRAAGLSMETACRLLRADKARGLVTCPLNKAMLQEAGFDFPGHTEFLAERLGAGRENICMHLAGDRLRVSLVTTHPALARVPELVTYDRVLKCLELTWELMRRQGLDHLPIAVCGLNPHAGESGRIGTEDAEIIAPAVEAARAEGIPARGPMPADTVFHLAARGSYSSVLAMYHDQGLGPLKLLHFGEAVNITLGLPKVRTSPDHGTGYDLVGTGEASVSSLAEAVRLAVVLAG